MQQELYYVTSNKGKFIEVERYLKRHAPEIVLKQADLDIPEIQSMDQLAVAQDKAEKARQLLNKPFIIDDAAIYFERWHLFPGVLSKFVSQGLGTEGLCRLFEPGDRGYFLLYLVYVDQDGKSQTFEGRCDGSLVYPQTEQVHPDLPYNLIFMPDGLAITCAEFWGDPAYDDYLYRIRAVKNFLAWRQGEQDATP